MPQIFHRSFNVISRVSIFGAVFIVAFLGWVMIVLAQSPYATNAGNLLLRLGDLGGAPAPATGVAAKEDDSMLDMIER